MRLALSLGSRQRAAGLVLVLAALAGSAAFSHGGGAAPLGGAPDRAAAEVVHAARAQVGDAYAWGGNGPDAWDCSGLTSLWKGVPGVTGMPRTSRDQQRWAVPIPKEQLLVGDLVFFNDPVDHVGIYLGGGRMVDASSAKRGVVERAVWSAGTVRYGRVPRPGMPKVAPWGTAAATPQAAGAGLPTLTGLPATQRGPSSAAATRAAEAARSFVGQPVGGRDWTDAGLVRVAYRGRQLPLDRAALVSRGRTVPLSDARVGDVVVYGAPDTPHVGVYVGGGQMVDASPRQGRVVLRPVYAATSVRLVRIA